MTDRALDPPHALGTLEIDVMEVLWEHGESKVGDVMGFLGRPLAYTTVMTTLDRLFKKGMLGRRKLGRAFSYVPTHSRHRWEVQQFASSVAELLSAPPSQLGLLMSCLVEVVGNEHGELLDELEKRIQAKRAKLDSPGEA